VFAGLRGEFEVEVGAEITVECAPGQLSGETLEAFQREGVNRLSFGVQSFVDEECAAVGRLHTGLECREELRRVAAAGVKRVGVDLIVGLPHQTEASWRYTVDEALASGVEHVSVYMLEVDEDSRLGREMLSSGARYSAGEVPSEDETAEWYSAACGWLEAAGIRQYEISNFAREDHSSRHNVKYWRREAYLGFGLDAHSMLRTATGAVRRANVSDLDAYLASGEDVFGLRGSGEPEVDLIGLEQGFEEALFLGLRMNVGVELEGLRAEFGDGLMSGAVAVMAEVEEAGLVSMEGGRVRLTGRGRMVSNEVFSRLLVGAPA
jgi:oxygen-independent coproporphyrinogen III oxidase